MTIDRRTVPAQTAADVGIGGGEGSDQGAGKGGMMARSRAILMKPDDNVCTVLGDLAAGSDVSVGTGEEEITFRVVEPIPFGHKFATSDIKTGDPVKKYGERIGIAIRDIKIGQHVHVHNIESCRGRGDK
jgi:altronate dehydratase small subunit